MELDTSSGTNPQENSTNEGLAEENRVDEAVASEVVAPEAAASEGVAPEAVSTDDVSTEVKAAEVEATEVVSAEEVTAEVVSADEVTAEDVTAEDVTAEDVVTQAAASEAVASQAVASQAGSSGAGGSGVAVMDAVATEASDFETVATEVAALEAVATQAAAQGGEAVQLDDPKSIELSAEFVGLWANLISTTNWDKGRIITQWREALMGSEAPAAAYSDEAWSRRVGGVSPQHVGRLRRVFERFGAEFKTYEGVYWSHFLAALDWDDAEMWLEGAVQSHWSVSQMRRTRWESMGSQAGQEPTESDISSSSMDEDFTPLAEVGEDDQDDRNRAVAEGPRADGPDFGDEDSLSAAAATTSEDDADDPAWEDAKEESPESPFAKLPSLPVDLSEAVEQFKLAIIRHRATEWAEVSQGDVGKALDALRTFMGQ